jgi:hypothetical protein
MSNYTAVNVPPQTPEREVKAHEIVLPAQGEPVKTQPTPTQAAKSWTDFHKQVKPQVGLL